MHLSLERMLLVSIEVILFTAFVWALVWWFKKTLIVNRWELHFIKASGIVFVLAHLSAALLNPLPPSYIYWSGISLMLLSGIIFFWSLSTFRQPPAVAFAGEVVSPLNTSGPYRFVRHPFYTSYLLAWFSGSIASGCYPLLATFLVMSFIYYRSAKEEEQQWLAGKDKTAYQQYMAETGMFLPFL